MGRPPKPLERMKATARDSKHKADGRPLPVPVSPTTPERSVPPVPEGVEGRGAVEWERVWTAGFWLKRDQDWPWVEMIARAYQDIEEYRAYIKEHGLITKGYAGQDAANPMIAEIRKCEQTIQKCLQILGFSPTDRAKLAIVESQAQNALQKMIQESRQRS